MNLSDENGLFLQPTKQDLELIFKEIHLTEKTLEERTNSIKEWIQSQSHLPQCLGDADIRPFLIWAKGDLAECQKRLDSFYSMRSRNEKLFGPRDPLGNDFKKSFSCSNMVILPRQYEGYSVLMMRPTTSDPTCFEIEGFVRRVTLLLELSMKIRPLSRGLCIIIDEELARISYLTKLSPSVITECLYCIQNVLPLRIKLVVIINVHRIIKVIFKTLLFPFVKKKIMNRIHLHSEGSEILQNYFPKEVLPSDFGGEGKTLQQLDDSINSFLISKRDYILKENTMKADDPYEL